MDRVLLPALAAIAPGAFGTSVSAAEPAKGPAFDCRRVKGRNDSWKDADRSACVKDSYVRRTAGLQAKYRLVEFTGPLRLACSVVVWGCQAPGLSCQPSK